MKDLTMRPSVKELRVVMDTIDSIVRSSDFIDLLDLVIDIKANGGTFYFVGNGGSAAIASHMAIDWMKNGKMRAMAFNDGAALTCLSNDLGYDKSFSVPLQRFGRPNDVLFAISSSGQSQNIIKAVEAGKKMEMHAVTLSGFRGDNPLLGMGEFNFYLPSMSYGAVEIGHLSILHCLLDEVIADGDKK